MRTLAIVGEKTIIQLLKDRTIRAEIGHQRVIDIAKKGMCGDLKAALESIIKESKDVLGAIQPEDSIALYAAEANQW